MHFSLLSTVLLGLLFLSPVERSIVHAQQLRGRFVLPESHSFDLHHRRLGKERETPSPTSSSSPSSVPSLVPSVAPSGSASAVPSVFPSDIPTAILSVPPSNSPAPSQQPSGIASVAPTESAAPTVMQTVSRGPSSEPTTSIEPTATLAPSESGAPSTPPTSQPTSQPTHQPTSQPVVPTRQPIMPVAPVIPTAPPSLAALSGSLALAPFSLRTSASVPEETLAQVTADYLFEGLSSKYFFLTQIVVLPQATGRRRLQEAEQQWSGQARFNGPPPPEAEFHEDQLFLLQGDGLQTAIRNHPDVDNNVVVTAVEDKGLPSEDGDDGPSNLAVLLPVLSAIAVTIFAATFLFRRRNQQPETVRHVPEDTPEDTPPPPPPLAEFLVQSATATAAGDGMSMITMDAPSQAGTPTKEPSPQYVMSDADSVVSKLQMTPKGTQQLLLAPIPATALAASKRLSPVMASPVVTTSPARPSESPACPIAKSMEKTRDLVEEKKEDDLSQMVHTSSARDEDSMDGYSLSSERLSPVASKWLAHAIGTTTTSRPQEEYHSDSESQFSFANVGAQSVAAQSLLLGSQEEEQEEEEMGEEVVYHDAMRFLQTASQQVTQASSYSTNTRLHEIQSAPSSNGASETPTLYLKNRLPEIQTASEEPPSLSWSNANRARLLQEDDDDDPLRAAVYTPMAAAKQQETDSMPSDELEDARDQDLDAFAAELEKLQSDARLEPSYFFTPAQGTKKPLSSTLPTMVETPVSSIKPSRLATEDPSLSEYLRERRRAQYAYRESQQ